MTDTDLLSRYNYDAFVPKNFEPWMRFEESPPLGRVAPDFALVDPDGSEVRLKTVVAAHAYTIVEFGSFT
jgi:hypothetical protein